MLWSLDASGKLTATRVRTGLTDRQNTQVSSQNLQEGMRVIVGLPASQTASSATPSSPFQQQASGGPRAPGGF